MDAAKAAFMIVVIAVLPMMRTPQVRGSLIEPVAIMRRRAKNPVSVITPPDDVMAA